MPKQSESSYYCSVNEQRKRKHSSMADLRDLWTSHRPWPPNLLKSWFQIWCSLAAMDGALSHLALDLKFVHLLLQI
ncbi:hypothetical protein NL676_005584 [Syzygium grande]|nr:hypothetical protein NL676_005584 [Syzygium grande]